MEEFEVEATSGDTAPEERGALALWRETMRYELLMALARVSLRRQDWRLRVEEDRPDVARAERIRYSISLFDVARKGSTPEEELKALDAALRPYGWRVCMGEGERWRMATQFGRHYLRVQVYKHMGTYLVWRNVVEMNDGTRYEGGEMCTLLEKCSDKEREIAATLPVEKQAPYDNNDAIDWLLPESLAYLKGG